MTNRMFRTSILALAATLVTPCLAGSAGQEAASVSRERYVRAGDDFVAWLFAGPRYYDKKMITTAAGACA